MPVLAGIRYFGMNGVEMVVFGCALGILGVYAGLESRFTDLKTPLGWTLILVLSLYLAVESTARFLTVDATYNIFSEITQLASADMTQFRLGSVNCWPGWGEEVMLVGRRIEQTCEPGDCHAVKLYAAYPASGSIRSGSPPANPFPAGALIGHRIKRIGNSLSVIEGHTG